MINSSIFQCFNFSIFPFFFHFSIFPPARPLARSRNTTHHNMYVCMIQGGAGISHYELADLCLACARCGWDCAASVGTGDGGGSSGSGGLSVHVGVGCGRVSCFHVGGDRLGWQLVVSGELFEDQVRKVSITGGVFFVMVDRRLRPKFRGGGSQFCFVFRVFFLCVLKQQLLQALFLCVHRFRGCQRAFFSFRNRSLRR